MNDGTTSTYSDGEVYEAYMGKWSRDSSRRFIDWLGCDSGLRWLDVGCGTGAVCEAVRDLCAPEDYVGVDAAQAQIDFARSTRSGPNVRFQLDDALALSFDDDSFDAAVSGYVVNFLPDPQRMIAEMTRAVRPSGIVAAWTWDFATNKGVSQHINSAIAARRAADSERARTVQQVEITRPEALARLFRVAGLENVRTTRIETTVSYRDFDDYWDSNFALNAKIFESPQGRFMTELTDQDRARFVTEVRNLVPTGSDGSIRYGVRSTGAVGTVPPI